MNPPYIYSNSKKKRRLTGYRKFTLVFLRSVGQRTVADLLVTQLDGWFDARNDVLDSCPDEPYSQLHGGPELLDGMLHYGFPPVRETSVLPVVRRPPDNDVLPGWSELFNVDHSVLLLLEKNYLPQMIIGQTQLPHQHILGHYGDEGVDGQLVDELVQDVVPQGSRMLIVLNKRKELSSTALQHGASLPFFPLGSYLPGGTYPTIALPGHSLSSGGVVEMQATLEARDEMSDLPWRNGRSNKCDGHTSHLPHFARTIGLDRWINRRCRIGL